MNDDLIERLELGVSSCGMHDDNETELFDIDDANNTMIEAARTLRAKEAEIARCHARLEIDYEYNVDLTKNEVARVAAPMENRLLREDGITRRDATIDRLKLHLSNALETSDRYRYALWAIIECVQYSADSNPVWAQIASKVLSETSDLPRGMVQGDC
ncbi:hypothetical protein FZC33_07305 [Labrys sp. KNU-23]|uniref:hypothetical protein n=1 Tax=Labrys sp. KNU-23 TaxID=2789216 RepID=UPI0011ECDB36|nr:hypothetical protein [Labrys sp. KNU-23]QEN86011.1 hypothetical protein FZC33_07305 [Labrys sp. KNU-23]